MMTHTIILIVHLIVIYTRVFLGFSTFGHLKKSVLTKSLKLTKSKMSGLFACLNPSDLTWSMINDCVIRQGNENLPKSTV